MSVNESPTSRQIVGGVLLYGGIGLWILILMNLAFELPFEMPRTWYRHRHLWGMIGGLLVAAGWKLQRNALSDSAEWKPASRGRRFRRLIVYSRLECHLCDDAKAILARYLDYLPEIESIDIDTRPELQERFGTTIPVVEFDGVIRFRGRVDEHLLRRLIEGTEPDAEEPGG
jgi:hypothetical protein